jgi:hypothetical protein
MGLAGQPASVKLLGVYCGPKTLAEILTAGYTEPAPFSKALLISQFPSDFEAKKALALLIRNSKRESAAGFNPQDPAIKKIFEHYEKAGKDPASGTSAKIAGLTFLGTIMETEDVLAEAAIVSLNWSGGGSEISTPFAVSMAFMRLGKLRVDLLFAYPLHGQPTVTNCNGRLLAWIADIQRSNNGHEVSQSQTNRASETRVSIKKLMSAEEFNASGLSKLSVGELTSLDAWFEKQTLAVAEYFAERAKPDTAAALTMEDLLNCTIVGDDGEFLGLISTSTVDSKSIMNTVGRYGSSVSSTCILNSVSRYGSTVSRQSAFCDIASSPPSIFSKDGKFLAFLTTNTLKSPRIDPNSLVGWLKSK